MAKINTLAKDIGIKKIRGSEIELLKWFKENPTLYILEIESYQFIPNKYSSIQTQGFWIYYKKETNQ